MIPSPGESAGQWWEATGPGRRGARLRRALARPRELVDLLERYRTEVMSG